VWRLASSASRKTFSVGQLADEDGVTVEAEGVFIHPKQTLA